MHRAVLEACVPLLAALTAAFVLLAVLLHFFGRGVSVRQVVERLRSLHRCEQGAVQSLSFVLTLPIFIVICMFIVQVSQLMIGVMVVHYAAYAAARSAVVWIPAQVDIPSTRDEDDVQNKLGPPITAGHPVVLTADDSLVRENFKYRKIFEAAAIACAPISPSRNVGYPLDDLSSGSAFVMQRLYESQAPESLRNERIPDRIEHKLAYSFRNTAVRIEFRDKNSYPGPTYNPRVALRNPETREVLRDLSGNVIRIWDPHEVGWEDPVRVLVTHEFALLPGPGRVLAKHLVRNSLQPDRVAERIHASPTASRERLYTTSIVASATLTNEGFQSVIPYVQKSY